METLLFLGFVAIFGLIILWPMQKAKKRATLARRPKGPSMPTPSQMLSQPGDALMSNRHQVWAKRQKKAGNAGIEQPDFVPRFEKADVPEYDGYSRRGRHHITPTANVKKAGEEQQITMTAMKFEQDSEQNLPKASSGKG